MDTWTDLFDMVLIKWVLAVSKPVTIRILHFFVQFGHSSYSHFGHPKSSIGAQYILISAYSLFTILYMSLI
jgi:hypothetical protein